MDIDVVIPWVDPSDKAWIESKNKYLGIEAVSYTHLTLPTTPYV